MRDALDRWLGSAAGSAAFDQTLAIKKFSLEIICLETAQIRPWHDADGLRAEKLLYQTASKPISIGRFFSGGAARKYSSIA